MIATSSKNVGESKYFWIVIGLFTVSIASISNATPVGRLMLAAALIGGALLSAARNRPFHAEPFLTAISCSFGFYFVLESPIFPASDASAEILYFAGKAAAVIVLGLGYRFIRSLRSTIPLVIITLFYIDSIFVNRINLGISKSATEYFSIWECLLALYAATIIGQLIVGRKYVASEFRKYLLACLLVGHIANYFAAGLSKALLNGGVFSWLGNATLSTLKRADMWGVTVPASLLKSETFLSLEPIGNAAVFFGQLASSLVVVFPWLIGPITLFYDAFHIGVGISAGVWFYKWIFVNLVIYWYRKEIAAAILSLTWPKRLALTALIPAFFFISSVPHLGWYEYRQGALIFAYGINADGTQERLHHQFFGSASFSILDKNTHYVFDRGLPRQMAGTDYREFLKSTTCERGWVESSNVQLHRQRLTELTRRLLSERSKISGLLMAIQPYHILIPPAQANGLNFVKRYEAIRFDLVHVCLDSKYKVISKEVVDSFEVTR
ncbi:hypothetical protein D9M72_307410 [compost metagenome]